MGTLQGSGRSTERPQPRLGSGEPPAAVDAGAADLILQAKIHPPAVRVDSWIRRDRLLDRLAGARDRPLLLVDAPVGYGKTVLLAQWVAEGVGDRAVAWLSHDPHDADPNRMFSHVVAALRRSFPAFGASTLSALRAGAPGQVVVSRLLNELADLPEPTLLVLDDYHFLRGEGVHEPMAFLAERLPSTVQLAIATRADPPLPLGRLRAEQAMFELRADDLRFDEPEAAQVLRSASGTPLEPTLLRELVDRTEGWPAGVYLAALSLRSEADPAGFVRSFTGSHRHVADYLTEEVLRREPEEIRRFLVRTSIFERFCAEVCDAVLGWSSSRNVLDELEHSNLFLVGLDDRREWYRYHHLFRELLTADLLLRERDSVPELHRRASEWFDAHGFLHEAVQHALASGDRALTGRLISRYWRTFVNGGRTQTVRSWLQALGETTLYSDPVVALTAAWVAALGGEPERADELLSIAEAGSVEGPLPDGTASLESGASLIRGLTGFDGLKRMRSSMLRAAELESPPDSPWRGYVHAGLGWTAYLSGDLEEAQTELQKALVLVPTSEPVLHVLAASGLSLVEGELGHTDRARRLAEETRHVVEDRGLTDDPRGSLALLAMGKALSDSGELEAAAPVLERALAIRTAAGRLSPWPTVLILLALAPVRFGRDDRSGARQLLDQARDILSNLEDSGDMFESVERTKRALQASAHRLEFGQKLTHRELAVLRLLPTGLSQRDIGRQLFLSLNTVKSHTRAIYRKLGTASRTQAVAKARDLGIL